MVLRNIDQILKKIPKILIDEIYNSKCSYLDDKSIEKHKKDRRKRMSKGLIIVSNRTIIKVNVNKTYNIVKKIFLNAIVFDGIKVFGLMPQLIFQNIYDTII